MPYESVQQVHNLEKVPYVKLIILEKVQDMKLLILEKVPVREFRLQTVGAGNFHQDEMVEYREVGRHEPEKNDLVYSGCHDNFWMRKESRRQKHN